jgi:hypothetical protein
VPPRLTPLISFFFLVGDFQTGCGPMIIRPWVADGRGWAGDKGQSSDMAAWALIGQAHNRDTVLQLDAMRGPLRGDPFMHFLVVALLL